MANFLAHVKYIYDKQVDNGVREYQLPVKTTKEFDEAIWILRDKIVEELRKQ